MIFCFHSDFPRILMRTNFLLIMNVSAEPTACPADFWSGETDGGAKQERSSLSKAKDKRVKPQVRYTLDRGHHLDECRSLTF